MHGCVVNMLHNCLVLILYPTFRFLMRIFNLNCFMQIIMFSNSFLIFFSILIVGVRLLYSYMCRLISVQIGYFDFSLRYLVKVALNN